MSERNIGLWRFFPAKAYRVANPRVAVISTAVRNSQNWAGTLGSVGKGVPVISIVLIGTIDYAEWLAAPETESELTHLIGTLIVDISKVAIATIAGTIAAAFAVSFGWSLVVIAFAGITAGVIVGIMLDSLDTSFGVTNKVQSLARDVEMDFEDFLKRRESDDWVSN